MHTDSTPSYSDFLASKLVSAPPAGFDVELSDLNPQLFDFQRHIVQWSLRRGRAAIFADCGLGKTPMQLEWARFVAEKGANNGRVLILAPLAVAQQTHREGEKFGVSVTVCRTAADVRSGINVANYERLHLFNAGDFDGIVLDESSILKSYEGPTRKQITDFAQSIPYRLACTATPAPNDLLELTNHAEFLNVMSAKEILALFFTQDGNSTHAWRLKGHAREPFWRWMASWSVALRKPSDLDYSDDAFILPDLRMHQVTVDADKAFEGALFPVEALTMDERRAARRDSIEDRVKATADLVNRSSEQWLVWCNLNSESEALAKAIPDAVEITGSDTIDAKEQAAINFTSGRARVLVSKPLIFGFGMNFQHCHNVAFVGLSDSYEQFYQAIRRCWRFGQQSPVDCYVITAETEGAVVKNIQRKEKQSMEMMDSIVRHMASMSMDRAERESMVYEEDVAFGNGWTMYLGDCVKTMEKVKSDSIGLAIFSPPFPGMYTYTNSPADMGNVKDIRQMIEHMRFMIGKENLLRVLMPGRHCCIHLTQSVAFKHSDGYIGLKDYRGAVIEAMEAEGWIYYGEVCIDKNPQLKAIRTKDRGLLFKTLATDSANMHMALADYLLQFRKPGENPRPIRAGVSEKYDNREGWITSEEWIKWASPVWYDVRETDVLNVAQARETDDERHLCPLQLTVIERAVKLWTAPGETVLSPFAGIGSEGVGALRCGRDFIGMELKRSYFESAVRNLQHAETRTGRMVFAE